MSNKKSILKLSLVVAVVAAVLAMFLVSLSLADEAAKPAEEAPAIPEAVVTEGTEATAEEAATEEAAAIAEEAASAAVETAQNADIQLQIYKPDGVTPATENTDYTLEHAISLYPAKITILKDDLKVVGNGEPVNAAITVKANVGIENLTLKNVNLEIASPTCMIDISGEASKDWNFTLNIEGNCRLSNQGSYNSVNVINVIKIVENGSFKFYGDENASLKIETNRNVYIYGANFCATQNANLDVYFSGGLNFITDSRNSISAANDENNSCNLIFNDNVLVNITDVYEGILCESDMTVKDSAKIKIYSEHVGIDLDSVPNPQGSQSIERPVFLIEDNASIDLYGKEWYGVYFYDYDFIVDTTGTVSFISDNRAGLAYWTDGEEGVVPSGSLIVLNGTLYLSGYYHSSDYDTSVGALEMEPPYFYEVADNYKVLGSETQNEPIENLTKSMKFSRVEPPLNYEADTTYVESDSNKLQLAKTVAFIPAEPVPGPTPDVPGGNVQEVDAAAQTGDCALPIAAFAVVAIASAGAAFGARKLRKN